MRGSGSGVLLRGMCTGACINALHTKLAFFPGRGVFHEGCNLRAKVGALTTAAAGGSGTTFHRELSHLELTRETDRPRLSRA